MIVKYNFQGEVRTIEYEDVDSTVYGQIHRKVIGFSGELPDWFFLSALQESGIFSLSCGEEFWNLFCIREYISRGCKI